MFSGQFGINSPCFTSFGQLHHVFENYLELFVPNCPKNIQLLVLIVVNNSDTKDSTTQSYISLNITQKMANQERPDFSVVL